MRALRLLATLFSFALGIVATEAGEANRIVWPKRLEVSQGELIEVKVSGADLAAVEGQLGNEKIVFYPNGGGIFAAIVGADVEAKPIVTKLSLKATTSAGVGRQADVPFAIKAKTFHSESFNVSPGFDQMSPETLEEIRREQAEFARAFAASAAGRLWDGPFLRPVPQEASASSFGARRIINGMARMPHTGTDLSAPAGTEVLAANHGRIVLAGKFFFAGASVVIDHGGGLFTMYFHLSEFKVEEGMAVRRGDVIGLSGATGRVTGAHLHWGARLGSARIEPFELIKKISSNDVQREPQTANKTEK